MDIAEEEESLRDLVSYLDSINQLEQSELSDDVIELRSNLVELIALKKEQIFESKKSSLLQKCDNKILEIDPSVDPVGTVRSIEFRFYNGSVGRRNVVIFEREYMEAASDTQLHYRCFFAHPVYQSELPCDLFLENEHCPDPDSCGRCHGEVIEACLLLEPVETAFGQWQEGDRCLAQVNAGDVWKRCRLLFVDEASDSCVVETARLLTAAATTSDNVFDIPLTRVIRCDDYHGDEDDEHEIEKVEVSVGSSSNQEAFGPGGVNSEFGAWEKHTRGIGMKLLLQMGYRSESGLGKTLQGRIEPVAALPPLKNGEKKPRRPRGRVNAVTTTAARKATMINEDSSVDDVKRALAANDTRARLARASISRLEQLSSRHGHKHGHPLLGQLEARLAQNRQKLAQLAKSDARLTKQLDKHRKSTQRIPHDAKSGKTTKKLDIF